MTDVKLPPLPEADLFTHQTLQPERGKDGLQPSGVHLGVKERGICEQDHVNGETDSTIYQWVSFETLQTYARLAVLQERERCAKICKDIRYNKAGIFYEGYDEGCDDCADAIRKGE